MTSVSGANASRSSIIVGVGTDLVAIARVADACERRPRLVERLFTPTERAVIDAGTSESARARMLAVRFAAKEAVMKSLGIGLGAVSFAEIEITGGRGSQPGVALSGKAARRADELLVDSVAVSLSHDAGLASAMAVASRECACNPS